MSDLLSDVLSRYEIGHTIGHQFKKIEKNRKTTDSRKKWHKKIALKKDKITQENQTKDRTTESDKRSDKKIGHELRHEIGKKWDKKSNKKQTTYPTKNWKRNQKYIPFPYQGNTYPL